MPLLLYIVIFATPNLLGWVLSPTTDLVVLGTVSLAATFLFGFNMKRAYFFDEIRNQRRINYFLIMVFCLAFIMISLPRSAILNSILFGYTEEVRENALKLANPILQAAINLIRDSFLPYLIIASLKRSRVGLKLVTIILIYFYFLTFNLAKSFVIINTFAILFSVYGVVSLLPVLVISTGAMAIYAVVIAQYNNLEDMRLFFLDFVLRRILTLTPELGVDVRNLVDQVGFHWLNSSEKPFEMKLYQFIGHSDLETGWANVYFAADGFGRFGNPGVALSVMIVIGYYLWFRFLSLKLGVSYAKYLTLLFTIYIYMQGVFSLGLLVSFFVGPMMLFVMSKRAKF